MSLQHMSWRGTVALVAAVVLGGAAGTATVATSSSKATATTEVASSGLRTVAAPELERDLVTESPCGSPMSHGRQRSVTGMQDCGSSLRAE